MKNIETEYPDLIKKIKQTVGNEKYSQWMQTPLALLSGKTPLEILQTPAGVEEIERILIAINFGIPS
jgi:uncharacterized protein (DUF2384 family)